MARGSSFRMSSSKNHPLPAPPGQQRPRAKSNFSFRSNHSRKSSSSSHNKVDLHESHAEKESKRLQTKADPQMALNEAEPSMVAREKASLAPIRAIQHRDNQGNPIADPDRSNPTRSRWERPLDTIRSFEAAIDGNFHNLTDNRPTIAKVVISEEHKSRQMNGLEVRMVTMVDARSRTDRIVTRTEEPMG